MPVSASPTARQDTVWSRSALGARRGGGPTCENAGSTTHCALAETPGDARMAPETEDGREMTSDWTAFGRVDEDGTVYVKTAAGERAVGSWQAGTPEEGLAHFARRFDGVVTEVNLIETRLSTGAGDAARTSPPSTRRASRPSRRRRRWYRPPRSCPGPASGPPRRRASRN